MLKLSLWRKIAALCLVLMVSACGGAGGSASAPTGFTVTPGNGQITITWQAAAGVDYWLMYAATATPIDIKNPPVGHIWATSITSPFVVTGLANGTTYSFAMNGRTSGGPGGPQTASLSATPRYAGASWSVGTTISGSPDLLGLAYGTASDATVDYLAVGTGGKIFKATDGTTWSAVVPSSSVLTDFKGVTYAFGRFIAVGANQNANNILSSADLVNWTAATLSSGAITTGINAIASNGTTVVAVGDGGNAYSTTNGTDWAPVTTGVGVNLNGLAYSSAVGWVIVGAGGTVITSTDLLTWSNPTSVAAGTNLNAVTVTSGNVFVAVGDSGLVISSTNGVNWSAAQTLGTGPNNKLFAVSTDSTQFLAVGQAGKAFTSADGSTWSAVTTGVSTSLYAILGGVSAYVVVGSGGTNITAK